MMSPDLPSVLQGRGRESSISMVRALKQIKDLLELVDPVFDDTQDRVNASIDDVNMMLRHVAHEDVPPHKHCPCGCGAHMGCFFERTPD